MDSKIYSFIGDSQLLPESLQAADKHTGHIVPMMWTQTQHGLRHNILTNRLSELTSGIESHRISWNCAEINKYTHLWPVQVRGTELSYDVIWKWLKILLDELLSWIDRQPQVLYSVRPQTSK